MLPNGLSSGPRKFTKLTKPPIVCLRIKGVIVIIHTTDILVIRETYEECLIGTIKTIKLLLKLGLTVFTRSKLPRICCQFKGNVGYTYQ